jgi:hypothetical protein
METSTSNNAVEVIKTAKVAGTPARMLGGLDLVSFNVKDTELVVLGAPAMSNEAVKERAKIVRDSVRALFVRLLEHVGAVVDGGGASEVLFDLGAELHLMQRMSEAASPVRLASFFYILNLVLNEIKVHNRGEVFVLRLEADEAKKRIALGVSPSPKWAALSQAGKARAFEVHTAMLAAAKQADAARYASGERADGSTGYNLRTPETEAARLKGKKVGK